MHAIFVAHPMFEEILDEISFHIKQYEPEGEASAPCLPVVGPTGVGKSTLFKKLRNLHPRVPNARRGILPNGLRARGVYYHPGEDLYQRYSWFNIERTWRPLLE
ncbi:TniB family NTP-binding protein [Bradyrhizobium barranii]